MANNYTQFSFMAFTDLTEPERTWLDAALVYIGEAADTEGASVTDADELRTVLADDYDFFVGYEAELDEQGLWIHDPESGTPDAVVPLVQEFLRRFRPDDCVGFEWSQSCSKPRLDEFAGGAVFITATDCRWMHTGQWLSEQITAHPEASA